MKQIPLVHFIQWEKIPDEQLDPVFADLKVMGVDNIVLHPYWWMRDEQEGSFLKMIYGKMMTADITGTACHGLWGSNYDLNCPDEERRKQIVLAHCRFMNRAADMGCLTYTVHSGEPYPEYPEKYLAGQIHKTLDALLPAAEKSGIKIALENMIKGYAGSEVTAMAAEYNHPSLGLCLDVGHAYAGEGLENDLKNMGPYLITCHLHDNNGQSDQHLPPGYGSIDWDYLIPALKACPALINAETEAGQYKDVSLSAAWELFRNIWSETDNK